MQIQATNSITRGQAADAETPIGRRRQVRGPMAPDLTPKHHTLHMSLNCTGGVRTVRSSVVGSLARARKKPRLALTPWLGSRREVSSRPSFCNSSSINRDTSEAMFADRCAASARLLELLWQHNALLTAT